jgi:UDP:flavonoid glycosyltransferase YjiC (YdhE family)
MLELKEGDSQEFFLRIEKGVPPYSPRTFEQMIDEDLRILTEISPTLVFGDLRISLTASARMKKVFFINITNAYWSSAVQGKTPIPWGPITQKLGEKTASFLFSYFGRPFMRLGYWLVVRPYQQILKKRMLQANSLGKSSLKFTDYRDFNTDGDQTFFFETPELVSLSRLKDHHKFMGPLLWSSPEPTPSWWSSLDRSKPWIFVGLGSSGQPQDLPVIVRALLTMEVEILVSTGPHSLDVPPHPRLHCAATLPLGELADHFRIALTNGGSPTSYFALSCGVPVIGVVSNMDQVLTMANIEASGAGLTLRHGGLTEDKVFRAVELVLKNEKFKTSAERIQVSFRNYDVKENLKQVLKQILQDRESRNPVSQ